MISQYYFPGNTTPSDSNDSPIGLIIFLLIVLGLTGYWVFQIVTKEENVMPAPDDASTSDSEGKLINPKTNVKNGPLSFLGIH